MISRHHHRQVDDTMLASSPGEVEHVVKTAAGGSDIVGVNTWERLMQRIGGRGDQVHRVVPVSALLSRQEEEFEGLMLREWVKENLMLADQQERVSGGDDDDYESVEHDTASTSVMVATDTIPAGTLCSVDHRWSDPHFCYPTKGFTIPFFLLLTMIPMLLSAYGEIDIARFHPVETTGHDCRNHAAAAAAAASASSSASSSSQDDIPVR